MARRIGIMAAALATALSLCSCGSHGGGHGNGTATAAPADSGTPAVTTGPTGRASGGAAPTGRPTGPSSPGGSRGGGPGSADGTGSGGGSNSGGTGSGGSTGSGGGTGSNGSTGSGGSSGSGGGSGGGGTGGGSGGKSDPGIGYTPWGPDDPPVPTQYFDFAASSGVPPKCANLSDDEIAETPAPAFWRFAKATCLAMLGSGAWPTAGVPEASGSNAYQDCMNVELTAMLRRALAWHARNPARRPLIAYPPRSSVSPCLFRFYEVDVLTGQEAADLGVVTDGKVPVRIVLSRALTDPTFEVDGRATGTAGTQSNGDGMETDVVLVDPDPAPRRVTIVATIHSHKATGTVEIPAGAGSDGSSSG